MFLLVSLIINCVILRLVSAQGVLNDQLAPVPQYNQHNNILYFHVPENAPNNTYVGTIRASDGQLPAYILPHHTPESERIAAFHINLQTGEIFTNSILDREQRDSYQFVAIATAPHTDIKCTISITDVNDRTPQFLMPNASETNYVIEVPEGVTGIRKPLPLAVDYDTIPYGIKEFRLISGNPAMGMFRLVEHGAPIGNNLQLNNNPDSSSSISASDNPQLMQQIDQQAAVLIPSQPSMQSNSIRNLQTSYANFGASPSAILNAQSKFLIDIEVNQPLDRENQSSYQLIVEAVDGGQPPNIGRLMVTVNVQDTNDNDPVFTRRLYECQVKEDAPRGSFLLRVQAQDNDLDANSQITYSIKRYSSSSSSQSSISSASQQSTNSSDNVEQPIGTRYSNGANNKNTAGSSGSGNSGPNSNAANNNKQRSQLPNGAAQTASGKLMAQQQQRHQASAEAFDQQSSPQDSFKPSKFSGSDQLFEIDSTTGDITLLHQLDFETEQVHEFQVEARDHGKPSRSSLATVKVIVLDVNDDPLPSLSRSAEDRRQGTGAYSEASKSGDLSSRFNGDLPDFAHNYLQGTNPVQWFMQVNSSILFAVVLLVIFGVAFTVCLVKTRSRQPESVYNDTAGLTLTSNNGQTKQSPNHSASNELANGIHQDVVGGHHAGGALMSRHHEHHQRRSNGLGLNGINGSGSFGGLAGNDWVGFGSANGKMRHQYTDTSNLYHNLYHNPYTQSHQSRHNTLSGHNHHHHQLAPDSPLGHQMAVGAGSGPGHNGIGSAGNTMTLHSQHSHHLNLGGLNQQLSHLNTMHSNPHTMSSLNQQQLHNHHHLGNHNQNNLNHHHPHHQALAPGGGGGSGGSGGGGTNSPAMHHHHSLDHQQFCSTAPSQLLDRWFELGVPSQLVYPHDWYGSYNWDYLKDWAPEYHSLMPLISGSQS